MITGEAPEPTPVRAHLSALTIPNMESKRLFLDVPRECQFGWTVPKWVRHGVEALAGFGMGRCKGCSVPRPDPSAESLVTTFTGSQHSTEEFFAPLVARVLHILPGGHLRLLPAVAMSRGCLQDDACISNHLGTSLSGFDATKSMNTNQHDRTSTFRQPRY